MNYLPQCVMVYRVDSQNKMIWFRNITVHTSQDSSIYFQQVWVNHTFLTFVICCKQKTKESDCKQI